MSWQKKKHSTEISSGEIIVYNLISSFTLCREKKRDFRDSNQNKQNVQMNVNESE